MTLTDVLREQPAPAVEQPFVLGSPGIRVEISRAGSIIAPAHDSLTTKNLYARTVRDLTLRS